MDDDTRDLLFLTCMKLTASQREVIVDRRLLGRSQAAIAADMGCHQSNVQALETRAVKALGRMLRA